MASIKMFVPVQEFQTIKSIALQNETTLIIFISFYVWIEFEFLIFDFLVFVLLDRLTFPPTSTKFFPFFTLNFAVKNLYSAIANFAPQHKIFLFYEEDIKAKYYDKRCRGFKTINFNFI